MKIGIDLDGVVIDSETTFRTYEEMKDDAIRLLEENSIKFDKYYWKVNDKFEICKSENVDIMIDDDWRIVKKLAENSIKTLYFRDTDLVKFEENEYIEEVDNWGEIYRYIKETQSI